MLSQSPFNLSRDQGLSLIVLLFVVYFGLGAYQAAQRWLRRLQKKPDPQLFSSFDSEQFVENDLSRRLIGIVKAKRGGTFGVVGPRGSGKSWTLQRVSHEARARDGLGLWFPSPVETDPRAFISAISDVLAQEYIDSFQRSIAVANYSGYVRRRVWKAFGGVLLWLVFFTLLQAITIGDVSSGSPTNYSRLALTGLVLAFFFLCIYIGGRFSTQRDSKKREYLYRLAFEVQKRARYNYGLSRTSEYGATIPPPASFTLKLGRSENLSERPETLSTLIHRFRTFATELSDKLPGPIVIAIDELDRMESSDALTLLKTVKGIFEVANCTFFISIADDALVRRVGSDSNNQYDIFSSTFYQVFETAVVPDSFVETMLTRRGIRFERATLSVIATLACGNPRDCLRLADRTERLALSHIQAPHEVAGALMREEVELFRRHLLADQGRSQLVPSLARANSDTALALLRVGVLTIGGPANEVAALAQDSRVGLMSDWLDKYEGVYLQLWARIVVVSLLVSRLDGWVAPPVELVANVLRHSLEDGEQALDQLHDIANARPRSSTGVAAIQPAAGQAAGGAGSYIWAWLRVSILARVARRPRS